MIQASTFTKLTDCAVRNGTKTVISHNYFVNNGVK